MKTARALLAGTLLWCGASGAEEALPKQTEVFYSARVALREERASDALRLWLLRNSLVEQGETRGRNDAAFRSVVWASLGQLGVCPDGFPRDEDGAGIWPLALHNHVVKTAARGEPESLPDAYDAFEVGRQQRQISLRDVLTTSELSSVAFSPTACGSAWAFLFTSTGGFTKLDLEDRGQALDVMRRLLAQALLSTHWNWVRGRAAVEARIFSLDLMLANVKTREARQNASSAKQEARALGVSAAGAEEIAANLARLSPRSPQARWMRSTYDWPVEEWMSLSAEQRLFLFTLSKPFAPKPERRVETALRILDALIQEKRGADVERWLGFFEGSAERQAAMSGARARALLALDEQTGFRERSAVALREGVSALETGALSQALESFAYALAHSDASRDSGVVHALSLRWLSYVLARYQTDEQVVRTLQALVPRGDYNAVIEDLVWRAAFRADAASFERLVGTARRGSAFDADVSRLRTLAAGKTGQLATELRDASVDEPFYVLRFVRKMLERLELEDGDMRVANISTLESVRSVLRALRSGPHAGASNVRAADATLERLQSILDGVERLDGSAEGRARRLSTRRETFAGNVRLAPADAMPWPFVRPEPAPPSAFAPLVLKPVEWRDAQHALVLGWDVRE